jgi:hypothetical protein
VGGLFLWHFPRVTPPGRYPAPCPVESGLSSTHYRAAATRPAPPPSSISVQNDTPRCLIEQRRRRPWRPVILPGAGEPFVDALVRQPIGCLVELPRNVFERDFGELAYQGPYFGMQPNQRRVLHTEPPRKLFDQQAAVRTKQHALGAKLAGEPETFQRGSILRHIIGGDADALPALGDEFCIGSDDHHADAGRPGVPPRSAVAVDGQPKTRILRQYSHLRMPSVFFSPSMYIGESF